MTRIEQGIEDIEDYLAGCKGTVFTGANRVVVERDKMEELLAELRNRIPDEIKKYQKIVASKDSILAEAKEQAAQIVENARNQAAQISSEHEIMLQAEDKANAMIEQAERQAQEAVDTANIQHNEICEGAIDYADKMLASMLTVIRNAMDGADANFTAYMNNMRANYEIVESNLKELRGPESEPAPAQPTGYRGNASSAGYGSQGGYGSQSAGTGYGYGRKAEPSRPAGGSASDNYFGRETVGYISEDAPEANFAPEEENYDASYEESYEEPEEDGNPRSIFAAPEENAAAYASFAQNRSDDEYEDAESDGDYSDEEYSEEEYEQEDYSDEEYPEDEYSSSEEEYADVPDSAESEEESTFESDAEEEDRLEEEFARPELRKGGYRPVYEERQTPASTKKEQPAAPEIFGEGKGSRSSSSRSSSSGRASSSGRRGKKK